jgi:hypothetical protein
VLPHRFGSLSPHSQPVRTHLTARQHQRIETIGIHLIQRLAERHALAPVDMLPALDLARLGASTIRMTRYRLAAPKPSAALG